MALIQDAAYRASAELAVEKGSFPLYDAAAFLASPGVRRLSLETQQFIAARGMRNGLLTSIAPTGTISLLAGNVSSGIEPVFDLAYDRRILTPSGEKRTEHIEDHAYRMFRNAFGANAALTDDFVTTQELAPGDHLRMQAALQPHVDASISKTVNCPEATSFADFQTIYREAYQLGLKGCTVYRPNAVTGSVLVSAPAAEASPHLAEPVTAIASRDDRRADVVYMAKPLERDPVLAGATYKLKWPDSDHALYVTINDIVQDGRKRPFEIFINSKNLEHYAWTVALTRMISAVFRRGGDITFVVEELKAVFDPRGGQWMGGRYVPSLLAAIGDVIEKHMLATGYLQRPDNTDSERRLAVNEGARRLPGACPRCGAAALIVEEGCLRCRDCGYSKCS
jgi:ribonucleoside-diphosphate reductase alpha chain